MSLRTLALVLAAGSSLLLAPRVSAQQAQIEPEARRSVYLELLGLGGLYSLNFDQQFSGNWFARAGLEILGDGVAPNEIAFFPVVPLSAGALLGEGMHRVEIGGGLLIGYLPSEISGWPAGLSLGETSLLLSYRYQPRSGGLMLRVGFAPLLISTQGGGLQTLQRPGVSVGYAF